MGKDLNLNLRDSLIGFREHFQAFNKLQEIEICERAHAKFGQEILVHYVRHCTALVVGLYIVGRFFNRFSGVQLTQFRSRRRNIADARKGRRSIHHAYSRRRNEVREKFNHLVIN